MSIADKLEAVADVVYEKGRQAQKEEFWEQFLAPMNRGVDCPNFFCGTGWNTHTFYPTRDIRPRGSMANMFNYFSQHVTPYMDMAERLKECKVTFDTSNATNFTMTFAYCYVTRLPKITIIKGMSLDRTFLNSSSLVTIDELQLRGQEEINAGMSFNTFGSGTTIAFGGCTALMNITITGIIGNSISFANSSKLTTESLDSIVRALQQLESGVTAKTLTLHATVKANMTDTQKAIIQEKGWTLA